MSNFIAEFRYSAVHTYHASLNVEADNLQEAKKKFENLLYDNEKNFWDMIVITYKGSAMDYDLDPEIDVEWTNAD